MSDGLEIKPASVPLSHRQDGGTPERQPASRGPGNWQRNAMLAALASLLIAVFWWSTQHRVEREQTASQPPSGQAQSTTAAAARGAATGKQAPPPFAESQRALARTRAQSALARFVEQQIQLEEEMAVGTWGQAAFDTAMARALTGDELFVAERFEDAQAAYDEAAGLLTEIIEQGRALLQEHLQVGLEAIDNRSVQVATTAFESALSIDADNSEAQSGLERARLLPRIAQLELQARNHELAGEWQDAAQTYQQILALDAATTGINDALAAANREIGGSRLRDTLSAGFDALEKRRFSAAREAFNNALRMDPGNEIALGGLQQVNARTELATIASLQQQAAAAVSEERWDAAVTAYTKALQLDANIQFAKAGMRNAQRQLAVANALTAIIDDPDKLSSSELLENGRQQLANAKQLEPRGPRLADMIDTTSALLAAYAQPVAVQLTSDNATEVLVSTIGKLGAFSNRELSLRPGEYVLLGSRSGCRDVRQTVIVRPDMDPVDIRCLEELPR